MAILENLGKAIGFGTHDFVSGLAGSASSSLLGMAMSDYNAKRMFELNEQAAENAYKRQLDFWNMQNDYNNPSAQMERLRKAGLNPALMNGIAQNNVAGNLSSVPDGGASQSPSYAPNPVQQMLPLVSSIKELEAAGLLDAETKLTMSKIVSEGLEQFIKSALGSEAWAKANSSILDFVDKYTYMYPDGKVPEPNEFFYPGNPPSNSLVGREASLIEAQYFESKSRRAFNFSNIDVNNVLNQVNKERVRELVISNDIKAIDKELRSLELDIQREFGSANAFLDAYVKYATGRQSLSSSAYTDEQRKYIADYFELELAKLALDHDKLDLQRLQGGNNLGNIIGNVFGEGGVFDKIGRWVDDLF